MPTVNVSVPYQISEDEALTRIKTRIAQIKAQHASKVDLQENWSGYVGTFSGSVIGYSLSGSLVVKPSVVTVEIGLPFIASLYKGKIEAGIHNELTSLLA